MGSMKIIFALLALCVVLTIAFGQVSQGGPHTSQGGPHQNQGRIRRQVNDEPNIEQGEEGQDGQEDLDSRAVWTTCDFTAIGSKLSCNDCNTRLICKPVGGLLKACGPNRPYCNNGICSFVPSANCA